MAILERESIIALASEIIGENIVSIYDIKSPKSLQNIIESRKFIDFDNKGHGQYSSAIKHYITFLIRMTS